MRPYTITAARFANESNTAAVITTVEDADVLIGLTDTPERWAEMLASGVPIGAYREGDPAIRDTHPNDMGKPSVLRAGEKRDEQCVKLLAQAGTLKCSRWTFETAGQKIAKHLHTQHDSHVTVVTQGAFLIRVTGEEALVAGPGDCIDWPGGTEHELEVIVAPAQLFNFFKP